MQHHFEKELIFQNENKIFLQNLSVHLRLASITQYLILLNHVWLCNFENPYIKLPNYGHDRNCFSNGKNIYMIKAVLLS